MHKGRYVGWHFTDFYWSAAGLEVKWTRTRRRHARQPALHLMRSERSMQHIAFVLLEHVSMIVWCRTSCHHASRNVAFHDIVMTCTHARTHACTLEQLACMPMTPQYVIVAYGSCMFAQMCVDLNAFVGAWSSSKIDRSKLCRWCRKSMQPTYVRYVTRLTGHTGSQMHHVVGWIHNKLAVPQEDVMFTTRLHNRCVWSSFNCMRCYLVLN